MERNIISIFAVLIFASAVFAQKGVDTQTKKIQDEGVKSTGTPQRSNEPNRSFDFGKGKTKTRTQLANPYRMNSRRDILIENVLNVFAEQKLIVNDAASRKSDGIVVTEPYVFAKGAVITRNELNRYAILPNSDASWTRGRYTLTVEIQSIDGMQNNVSVTAKVEGRSENGLLSEWTTLQSTGAAEDEFLAKLVEMVTGKNVDAPQVIEPDNQK
ncbi:MAG: hypothetical protein LH472_05575 [Pyrinomonadaceae bacterium]|nr:hypothetical protein [Pyrinomonadaceae bacterium]